MSLNKLRASLRPKLNSSFTTEQDNDPNSLVKEIKLLKENFDALKTPKLYQKIVCQYKANLKNRRLAEAMSGKSNSGKSEFYGSMDMLSVLRDSQKVNEFKYNLSQKYEEEGQDSNKENYIDTSDPGRHMKLTVDFAVQTTPKQHINLEEFTKLRSEYDQQSKTVKVMEDDLSKIRIENIKLDKALKSAQENLAVLGKNQNNTSSSFSLPSEFKTNWELLAKDQIINVFSDFIDNPILVTNLIQEIIMICYDQVKTVIKEVNCNILKILNLGEKSEADIKKHLANFYQDHHSSIFKFDESRFEKIRNLYKKLSDKIFTHEYTNELCNFPPEDEESSKGSDEKKTEEEQPTFKVEIREEYQEQFEEMLETDDFNKFVGSIFYLCLFMLLNDPPLRVPIENFKNRKFVYKRFKKNDFICVDGFAKENSACLVILPAVVRNNYPYNGIKPSVLILQDEFITPKIMKVLEACDKEEQEKLAKKQEKELLEEKMNHNDQTTTEINAKNISIDEKYIPPSLNTTNLMGAQHNDLLSHSTNLLNHSNIIMSKKIDIEDLESDPRLLDNSEINEEAPTTDVTIQAATAKNQMILPPEGAEEDSSHNQTISNILTERKQHDPNTSSQLTPQQDSYSSSARERTKTKRYPLPLHNLDNSFKSSYNQENKVNQNKSLYVKPLSSRRDDYDNKNQSLQHNALQVPDTEEKHKRLNRSSFSSEVVLKNGNLNLHNQMEEGKVDDYSLNDIVTHRTNRISTYQDKNSGSKALSEYKNMISSGRGNSSNSKFQNYYHQDRSERDISMNRDTSQERDASYRVNELRDKIRKSFVTSRGTQGEALENSMISKLNDSSMIRQTKDRSDFGSRIRERPELNNTITTIKQSIELLKHSKAQNDRNRSRMQDSYEKLNTSMAGKIRNQSDRLSGSFLKQLDADESYVDLQPKRDGIVSRMVAEKMKNMEKKFQERQNTQERHTQQEEPKPSQVLNHDFIKQKLNKLGLNTRSISTNRSTIKREDENKAHPNTSFSTGLNRVGSSNKFNHKTERLTAKETEESLQIFRALKNIYQKN